MSSRSFSFPYSLAYAALMVALGCGACPPTPATQLAVVAHAESNSPRFAIRRPTAEEEFEYLFSRVLLKMPFYRAHGYRPRLPAHPAFQAAAEAGREPTPSEREHFARLFREEVYRASDYDDAVAVLSGAPPIVKAALRRLVPLNAKWGFRLYQHYDIVLTLYGPGGSYDTNTGTIVLLPRTQGAGADGTGAHAIVHEIVHMGIEAVIVQRFHLAHEVKEHLVDRICMTYLGDVLVGYKAQPMGPAALDAYVDANTVLHLPEAIRAFVAAAGPKATRGDAW